MCQSHNLLPGLRYHTGLPCAVWIVLLFPANVPEVLQPTIGCLQQIILGEPYVGKKSANDKDFTSKMSHVGKHLNIINTHRIMIKVKKVRSAECPDRV